MPIFEPLFAINTPKKGSKKGPFDPGPAGLGPFWGHYFGGIQEGVEKYADFNLGVPSRVKKRSQKGLFGVIWGSKRAILGPFWGSLFKGSQKGAPKKANWG